MFVNHRRRDVDRPFLRTDHRPLAPVGGDCLVVVNSRPTEGATGGSRPAGVPTAVPNTTAVSVTSDPTNEGPTSAQVLPGSVAARPKISTIRPPGLPESKPPSGTSLQLAGSSTLHCLPAPPPLRGRPHLRAGSILLRGELGQASDPRHRTFQEIHDRSMGVRSTARFPCVLR